MTLPVLAKSHPPELASFRLLVRLPVLVALLAGCGGAGRVPDNGSPVQEGEAVMWMGGDESAQVETVETGEPPPPLPPCPEVPDGGPPPDAGGPCLPRGPE